MSKSRKRLLIRLSLVSAVLGIGAVALIQARGGLSSLLPNQTEADGTTAEVTAAAPTATDSDAVVSSDVSPAINVVADARIRGLDAKAPSQPSTFKLPSPTASVLRGQDDGGQFVPASAAPTSKPPARISLGDSPAKTLTDDSLDAPPKQDPFGKRGSARGGSFTAANGPTAADLGQPPAQFPEITPADSSRQFDTSDAVPATENPRYAPPAFDAGYDRPGDFAGNVLPPAEITSPRPTTGATGRVSAKSNVDGGNGAASSRTATPSVGHQYAEAASDLSDRYPETMPGLPDSRYAPSASPLPLGPPPVALPPAGTSQAVTSATPGPRLWDGLQAPSLSLQKIAPAEIQVDKPATFQLKIQNTGQTEADNVTVLDRVPEGTEFVDSTPQATRTADGSLMWQLGVLQAGEVATIEIHLIPKQEGEIGSVASVIFQTQSSVRTVCTRPRLAVEHSAPSQVLIGQSLTLGIRITNPGTGAATGVILEENVPDGLSHVAGNELEYEVGTLRPGETRELQLTLKAEKAGLVRNILIVRGDANLVEKDTVEIEVIAPQLQVGVAGPTKRYLERQATYTLAVANPGTAPATNIEMVAFLPKGLKFVEANNEGQYNPQQHAVYWSLEQLPPQQQGDVQLTTLPIETGEQKLRVESHADLALVAVHEQAVSVDGLAELFFDVADVADPIEVGTNTSYNIRVLNQGSKAATNVRIAVSLPPELRPISGDGPTHNQIQGQAIIFEPLARLAPKGDALFKVQVQGLREGDQRIRVQLSSDEVTTPITKEESTRVYADR